MNTKQKTTCVLVGWDQPVCVAVVEILATSSCSCSSEDSVGFAMEMFVYGHQDTQSGAAKVCGEFRGIVP